MVKKNITTIFLLVAFMIGIISCQLNGAPSNKCMKDQCKDEIIRCALDRPKSGD